MYCWVNSASIWGIEPYIVRIEVDISSGMPYFNMVGLLSSEVKEARERVRTALRNSGESLPLNRVTVNLSPADRKKEGTGFDLPIAVSLLCAMGRIQMDKIKDTLVIGELGLDGEVKKVRGILPIVNMARKNGIKTCIIPKDNEKEGRIFSDIETISFGFLKELMEYFDVNQPMNQTVNQGRLNRTLNFSEEEEKNEEDFLQIIGQEAVKRALEVAVAGWHNILMIGPPGVGKSMLAARIPTIMPRMNREEQLEISGIQSICGLLEEDGLVGRRPFSAPHHSTTTAALIGGGRIPRPGEITIAHKGVLFLDELPEFQPNVLDALRQPLEEKVVKIHRMGGSYIFPADCLLVAAMNPCRCGYYPDRNKCNCSENDIQHYRSRISGPLMDRMDMEIQVCAVEPEKLNTTGTVSSKEMRERIEQAIAIQKDRQGDKYNSQLNLEEIRKYCVLGKDASDFMREAYEKFELSMRGYYKIIKMARTIADLEAEDTIGILQLSEAIAYRISGKDLSGM